MNTRRKTTYHSSPPRRRKRVAGTNSFEMKMRKKLKIWVPLLVLFALAITFLTGNKNLFTLYSLRQTKHQLQVEKQQLINENRELNEQIEKLETDLEFIEKQAREKYNLKRKNEKVYIVSPE